MKLATDLVWTSNMHIDNNSLKQTYMAKLLNSYIETKRDCILR